MSTGLGKEKLMARKYPEYTRALQDLLTAQAHWGQSPPPPFSSCERGSEINFATQESTEEPPASTRYQRVRPTRGPSYPPKPETQLGLAFSRPEQGVNGSSSEVCPAGDPQVPRPRWGQARSPQGQWQALLLQNQGAQVSPSPRSLPFS